MKNIALIGSTGSIGMQVCNVVRRYPEKFKIVSMVAGSNAERFLRQIREFRPEYAALADEKAAKGIKEEIPDGTSFSFGEEASLSAVEYGDVALIAATGFAGLRYTLRAIKEKKEIALANKETLVCGGEIVMPAVEKEGIALSPIDSEHSALWQALHFNAHGRYKKLIITASGGPFYSYDEERLKTVTAESALKHPTWKMGAKITIDSATLLNKGFEVIEAKWLYRAPLEKIQTIVQPESIIHSMVEFDDGAILAQMSYPSMEIPIQLALTYPERFASDVESVDFVKLGAIRFLPLERKRFPCYDLALQSIERGDNYPCALNGAGEVAVKAFLNGRISFPAIAETIEGTLNRIRGEKVVDYETLKETDFLARKYALDCISRKG